MESITGRAVVGRRQVDRAPTAQPTAGGQVGDWAWVVRTHGATVCRMAYRLTGDPDAAGDLTQEVFIRVFRSLSAYRPGTFEGWLFRITTNAFLDEIRRKRRIQFDDRAGAIVAELAGREGTPAQALDDNTLSGDVEIALGALPPDFRAAIGLRDIHGLSCAEIGVRLGVKVGTIHSRIHRGRALLRTALAGRAPRRRDSLRHGTWTGTRSWLR